ncbi:MAG TPA: hypothetical protein VFG69_15240 [Nannocystaceae bacterium]|nr:hypothetical protein [Nannocystaceae bacterium]
MSRDDPEMPAVDAGYLPISARLRCLAEIATTRDPKCALAWVEVLERLNATCYGPRLGERETP